MQYENHQHITAATRWNSLLLQRVLQGTNNVLRQAEILLIQSAGEAAQLLTELW